MYEEEVARKLADRQTFVDVTSNSSSSPSRSNDFSTTMRLSRRGGPRDRGVDLLGIWDAVEAVVVAQCKLEKAPVGGVYIRQLTGAVLHTRTNDLLYTGGLIAAHVSTAQGHVPGGQPHGAAAPPFRLTRVLGVMVSASGFTSVALRDALTDPTPLILVHMVPSAALAALRPDSRGNQRTVNNNNTNKDRIADIVAGDTAIMTSTGGSHIASEAPRCPIDSSGPRIVSFFLNQAAKKTLAPWVITVTAGSGTAAARLPAAVSAQGRGVDRQLDEVTITVSRM